MRVRVRGNTVESSFLGSNVPTFSENKARGMKHENIVLKCSGNTAFHDTTCIYI